jgi:hypothetical protein
MLGGKEKKAKKEMQDGHSVVVDVLVQKEEKDARLVYLERAPNYHFMSHCPTTTYCT